MMIFYVSANALPNHDNFVEIDKEKSGRVGIRCLKKINAGLGKKRARPFKKTCRSRCGMLVAGGR